MLHVWSSAPLLIAFLHALFAQHVPSGPVFPTASPTPAVVHSSIFENNSGTSFPTIATPAISTTTGNLLITAPRDSNDAHTITGVADTAGNMYTSTAKCSTVGGGMVQWWYAKNITGNAANVVTATFSANAAFIGMVTYEISNVSTTAPLDVAACTVFGDVAIYPTSAFTTTVAKELLIVGNTNGSGVAASVGTFGGVSGTIVQGGGATGEPITVTLPVTTIQTGIINSITVSTHAVAASSVVTLK